jgi:predicted nucleic acid-binding protein
MAPGLGILVDSSVWIDILRGNHPWTIDRTASFLGQENVIVADLVFVEIVRGAKSASLAKLLIARLNDFEHVSISNMAIARKATDYHLHLRSKGITVRGTVDLLLATWCIENDAPLLHSDRDFDGFEKHLGLKRWNVFA